MRASVREVNCAGGAGAARRCSEASSWRARSSASAQFGQVARCDGDAAVRRQIAGGDRLNGVESFVAEHRSLQIGFQHPPQLLLGAIQLRLHRAERQLQRLGQPFVLHAVQIVRGDQQPVIRRQPRDRLLEPIAQLEIAELPIGPPTASPCARVRSSSNDTAAGGRPCSCRQTLATMR